MCNCNLLSDPCSLIGGADYKLIYRHYATLYFVFCVDSSESELGILDLIQVFVETLDKCFENVCELDLIFHVDKVSIAPDITLEVRCQQFVTPMTSKKNVFMEKIIKKQYLVAIVFMNLAWLLFLSFENIINSKSSCEFLHSRCTTS